jgi:aldose 1-epimerase
MEEGYPGQVKITVNYRMLEDQPGYVTEIRAITSEATVLDINTHEYFDLSGGKVDDVFEAHELFINSKLFAEMNKNCLPTGQLCSVDKHSAFDFSSMSNVRAKRATPDKLWDNMVGFDISYVLGKWKGCPSSLPEDYKTTEDQEEEGTRLAARLFCKLTGIEMEVRTSQRAVHLYGGDYLCPELGGVSIVGKQGEVYQRSAGICLECQSFPNSANQGKFPSIVLEKGQEYKREIIHTFKCK